MGMLVADRKKLIPIIDDLKAESKTRKKQETLSIQLTIKGYDFQKDARFDDNCTLPNEKRAREHICVLTSDNTVEEECKRLGIDFKNYNDITGNSKEKIREKKKLTLKYDGFILHGKFAKHFNIKFIVQKRKYYFLLPNVGELEKMIENAKKTVQFKLRKNPDIAFPIGSTNLDTEKIFDNFETGINFLIAKLKKGTKNLQVVNIKTDQGKPVSLL